MKKGIAGRLCGLILVLMMAAIFLPKTALAATYEVESGKDYNAAAGDSFKFTLSSQTDVAIIGDSALDIWYGSSSAADSYRLDLSAGAAVETLDGRAWYFRVKSGSGTISFTWGEKNDTPARATEFSLNQGESKSFDEEGRFRYYLLNVTDASAKYTFKTDNSATSIGIIPGKVTTESWHVDSQGDWYIPAGESKTFVLNKGFYTFCGTCFSQNVQLTVTREKWAGITKLIPSNDGKIIGTVGTKFEYVVNYEPKDADSRISVNSLTTARTRMKLLSQKNGVATFEVDFTNDEENKIYTLPFSDKETTREYNKVVFSTEDGITATAEKMAGPEGPTLYGTMTGSTKSISIPVSAHPSANKFVAYYKNGSKWKKCGQTSTNSNGVYYVNCTGLKAGKTYTFRVYAYADGVKGGYLQVKGVTAYNIKPTKVKAVNTKATFHKKQKDYEWKFNWTRGWYKVYFTDYTAHTIKVTYKLPKKMSGSYVTVNGKEIKSGKTLSLSYGGKTKAGKKANILFQVVRKSGDCIAYGPSVTVKCRLKAP